MRISICIVTFRRPDSFARAARSVFAQMGLAEMDVELVAIDNSPEGSALRLIRALASNAPIPVRFAHERQAGAAHARNAALALATGDLIVWLDDDAEASPFWLDRLIEAQRELRADIVFGPIAADVPAGRHHAYFAALHERAGPKNNARIEAPLGLANSLMVRARALRSDEAFDAGVEEAGGDARLFAEAEARGLRFGWAAEAWITQHVAPERATRGYAMKRAFAAGRHLSETAASNGRLFTLAGRMLAGAAQAFVFGAAALIAVALRSPQRVALLERTARGAGKAFWFADRKWSTAAEAA